MIPEVGGEMVMSNSQESFEFFVVGLELDDFKWYFIAQCPLRVFSVVGKSISIEQGKRKSYFYKEYLNNKFYDQVKHSRSNINMLEKIFLNYKKTNTNLHQVCEQDVCVH